MTQNYPRPATSNHDIRPTPTSTLPYWRTQLHHLDEYRSTERLPAGCDIVIIGAGMAGVLTAYHFLQLYSDGLAPSIILLEARQVCSGATGRNGGHSKVKTSSILAVKNKYGVAAAEELARFTENVIYGMKAIVEKERLDCEFELRRSFDVYLDKAEAEEVVEQFRESVANGERWTMERDVVLKEKVEQITAVEGAKAAISSPACSLWPYKFVTQLLERIIRQINLQTNTAVLEVSTEEDTGTHFIKTTRGVLRARKVIFASNGYTAGVCPTYTDKMVPVRITASHLKPTHLISPHLSQTYNIAYTPEHVDYLNPRPDGGIVVGGGKWTYVHHKDLWYNNWDDSTLLPNVEQHFGPLMQRYFRGWEESGSQIDHLWTGIIGYTADERPHVGRVPGAKGEQYIIAGFNGGGMSMICSAAAGLTRMVKDGVEYEKTGMPLVFKPTMERLEQEVKDPEGRN